MKTPRIILSIQSDAFGRDSTLGWIGTLAGTLLGIMLFSGSSPAQRITVDGSLSPAQTLAGPNYAIPHTLGKQVGGNLFHSFGKFGLVKGESANFSGPGSVANVVGRVTGGTQSSIDGAINSGIRGANVYLINPAGMVFGPNATVNVSGAFHASTADYIRMSDGARFQATNPSGSTLTAAPPAAFGFLNASPPAITVDGSKLGPVDGAQTVSAPKALGLVGGPVKITNGARLSSPGGIIHVTGVASAGEVPVDPSNAAAFTVSSLAPVAITGGVKLDVGNSTILGSGGSVFVNGGALTIEASEINADNYSAGPGGRVALRGDNQLTLKSGALVRGYALSNGSGANISVLGGDVLFDAGTIDTQANNSGSAGHIAVQANNLTVRSGGGVFSRTMGAASASDVAITVAEHLSIDATGTALNSPTGIISGAEQKSSGPSGQIVVTAGTISLTHGGLISTSTAGSGGAGPVNVTVSDLTIVNEAVITSTTAGSGGAGVIKVEATNAILIDGAGSTATGIKAETFAGADAGEITIKSARLTIINQGRISSGTWANGNAGTIRIIAGTLSLSNSGRITTSTVFGKGDAGNVDVEVTGSLYIDGLNTDGTTGITSQAVEFSRGNAGTIRVQAGSLSIANTGKISASTLGEGSGGNVTVTVAGSLVLDGGVIISQAERISGKAGSVTVAAGSLSIANGGQISTNTLGRGNAGTVSVAVIGAMTVDGLGSGVTSTSQSAARTGAAAGKIIVTADKLFLTDDASISTSAFGSGDAGSVNVTASEIVIAGGAQIASATRGRGRGGEINVTTAGSLTIDGWNLGDPTGINSEALGGDGPAGNVTVNAAGILITNGGAIGSGTRGSGHGGNISIEVSGTLVIDGSNTANFTGIESKTRAAGTGDAGTVDITAGNLSILNGLISTNTFGSGSGQGGNIKVDVSDALIISGSTSEGVKLAGITSDTRQSSTGNAGTVMVSAGSISISDTGQISTSTSGSGVAGNVTIDARGILFVDGAGSAVFTGVRSNTESGSSGNAGQVWVSAGSVLITNGGEISTSTSGSGFAGDVRITTIAGAISLTNGAEVSSATSGAGAGGTVTVSSRGALTLSGGSGILALASAEASGDAGAVVVSAPQIAITSGAQIASTTAGTGRGGSVEVRTPGSLIIDGEETQIAASATGARSGAGGPVTVEAASLVVQGGGEIASTAAGVGRGGDIKIDVGSDIVLSGVGPQITAFSSGSGDAGSIVMTADTVRMSAGAAISTEATRADGGNIALNLPSLLRMTDSEITTSARGSGGNIAIGSDLVIVERSRIVARAQEGHGGNITIVADHYVQSADSIVDASSAKGISGSILIEAPRVDLNGSLVVLPGELRGAADVLRTSCAARSAQPQSSLSQAGRGGLLQDPDSTIPALYLAGRDAEPVLGETFAAARFPVQAEGAGLALHCR